MSAYKYSQWNVAYPVKDKIALLNTLTSAGIVLDTDGFERLRDGAFNSLDERLLGELMENGFIVSTRKENDENATFWRMYHDIKYRSVFEVCHLVVMPTYECNFRCTYCFEDFNSLQGAREGLITSELLLNWVEKLWHVYFKTLRIVFYGGEPLLRKELLKTYVKVMKEWGAQNGVRFSFSIVTNGALCSEEFIRDMLEYGLEEVQVTIDGVKEVHDQRRPFRNGNGSFEIVYSNILRMADLALNKLVIRANIDEHNCSRFGELVQLLKRDGLFSKRNVVFVPALVDPSPSKLGWCNQFIPKFFDERVQILKDIWMDLLDEIDEPRLLLKIHNLQFGLCNAKVADSYVVGSDGSLYGCFSLVGYEEGKIGDIAEGLNSRYAEFLFSIDRKVERCLEKKCSFVPLCTGGCFYRAYVEAGDLFETACPENFYSGIWLPTKASIYERVMEKLSVSSLGDNSKE